MPESPRATTPCAAGFIKRAAHDLRACFRAGDMLPDWIGEDLTAAGVEVPAAVADHLNMLRLQARRGDKLVVDLREYLLAGQATLNLETLSGGDWLDRAAERVVPEGWDVHVDEAFAEVTTDGDALARVLELILQNAVTHHDRAPGRIWLAAQVTCGAVVLRVDDDGPGIPADHLDKVFEPLATLKSRDVQEGSGLGLSIARQWLGSMGGEISAQARPGGRGTRIILSLPA